MEKKRLGLIEKYLTLWIFLAIIFGIALGYVYPEISSILAAMSIDTTSIPIAIGLILMMYPPLAKVKYEEMGKVFRNLKLLAFSLTQNWIVGPIVMFLLAIALLRDLPEFMMGAIFQILFYAVYIYIFITVALTSLGLAEGVKAEVSIVDAAKTVFIYLGIPFIGGIVTRYASFKLKGREWFENVLSPKISPITPIALLFTCNFLHSLQAWCGLSQDDSCFIYRCKQRFRACDCCCYSYLGHPKRSGFCNRNRSIN
ncbi:MAG: arsenite transporter [Archaeoglobaceae archaeon]|nr:arsenite transporter [Archaeoglobaceae archaeon]